MKLKEMRETSIDELKSHLKKDREKIMKLRFQKVSQPLKNYMEISQMKKEVAQLLTVLREKGIKE